MCVQQLSVFIENTPGKLADFTDLLAKYHIDILSLCVADTTNYGIARIIVSNADETAKILGENGYTLRKTEVMAVVIPDESGALAKVLRCLAEQQIVVEYLYSAVRGLKDKALIVFRVDQLEKAENLLKEKGYQLLTQQDIA